MRFINSARCVCVCVGGGGGGGGELNMDIKLWVERVGSGWRIDGGRKEVFRRLERGFPLF